MASALLANHPRTIVVQKPRKTFGSFLVAKNSNTPYSDATKVKLSRLSSLNTLESSNCLHFHKALKTHDAHTHTAVQCKYAYCNLMLCTMQSIKDQMLAVTDGQNTMQKAQL